MYEYDEQMNRVKSDFGMPNRANMGMPAPTGPMYPKMGVENFRSRENFSMTKKNKNILYIVLLIVAVLLIAFGVYHFVFKKSKSSGMGFRRQNFGFRFF